MIANNMNSYLEIEKIRYIGNSREAPTTIVSLKDLSFEDGKATAIIGPNGSGKSTLLNVMMGLRPDFTFKASLSGQVYSDRLPPNRNRIGYASQNLNFPSGTNVKDIFRYYFSVYDCFEEHLSEKISSLIPEDLENSSFDKISSGQKQRVNIFLALNHQPDLALLDEPERSLDDLRIRTTAQIIAERSSLSKTTIVATHNEKILSVAQNVIFLTDGQVIYQGKLHDLIYERLGEGVLEIIINNESELRFIMSKVKGISDCKMKIMLDDGRLLLFGSSSLPRDLEDSNIEKLSFTWRKLTSKDLLLSVEGSRLYDDCALSF
ncbi:ABC transporter ATP-binding protein [Vibrio sp. T3Y01]|nr:ABC transporter ATP-binding protein [Vibrio sp. T3Y01]